VGDKQTTAPERAPSTQDKRRRRRRRSRFIMLRRLLILTVVVVLAVVLWRHWDTLAPDKLIARLRDSFTTSAGTFPVDVSGTNVVTLDRAEEYVVAVSDSYLVFYNEDGAEVNRHACTYSNPLVRTAGEYVLLAEQNGKRVQLYTRSGLETELTAKERILSVALNEEGRFAVMTRGLQNYAVQVTVYDKTGEQVYARSRTKLATGVALSSEGDRLAMLSVEASAGVIHSTVAIFPTVGTSSEAVFTHTLPDTLLYRLEYMDDGHLAAIGETGVLLVDTATGTPTTYMAGDRRVLGGVVGSKGVALVLRDYGDTASGSVVVLDTAAAPHAEVAFEGEFRHVSTDGDRFLVLTDNRVQAISAAGAGGTASIEADGQRCVLTGDAAVVLGLNLIQSYDLQ